MFKYPNPSSYRKPPEGNLLVSDVSNKKQQEAFSPGEEKQLHSLVWSAVSRVNDGLVDQDLLDDLYQIGAEAFVKARIAYNPARGVKQSTLMVAFAKNAIIDYQREEYRHNKHRAQPRKSNTGTEGELTDASWDISNFENIGNEDPALNHLEGEEIAFELRNALVLLNPRQRELVQSLFWEDQTQVNIARKRGVTPGLIHKEFKRVEVQLKKSFSVNPYQS